jgi:hypothetical protein
MLQMAENFIRSSYYEKRAVPIVNLRRRDSASGPEAIGTTSINVDGLVSLLQEG